MFDPHPPPIQVIVLLTLAVLFVPAAILITVQMLRKTAGSGQ